MVQTSGRCAFIIFDSWTRFFGYLSELLHDQSVLCLVCHFCFLFIFIAYPCHRIGGDRAPCLPNLANQIFRLTTHYELSQQPSPDYDTCAGISSAFPSRECDAWVCSSLTVARPGLSTLRMVGDFLHSITTSPMHCSGPVGSLSKHLGYSSCIRCL